MTNLKSFWANFYKSNSVAGACYLSKESAEKHAGPNVLCAFELILCGDDGEAITDKKLGSLAEKIVGEQTKWQPIETAPKDQPILIRKLHQVGIAIYNPSIFGGWQLCSSVSFFQEETQSNMCNEALPLPTHWQPLPKPPQESV